MRLLLFNLVTDADDPVLGFATLWINAFAKRCSRVDVITMSRGRLAVAENVTVHSVGRERGWSEPRRALEFYRLLTRVLRQARPDGCFSHMMPLFSAMGGPLLQARGIPLVTWYAHARSHLVLRLAHAMSDRLVTSLPSTYPLRDGKVVVIGQGIDARLYASSGVPEDAPPMFLSVGRLSPVKDHPTLLRAAARLRDVHGTHFRVVLLGQAIAGQEDYVRALEAQVRDLGLDGLVAFEAAVPVEMVARWHARAAAHVNLTPRGSGDKVVWEAMASGRPSLVANDEFGETLGQYREALTFPPGNDEVLAARLAAILALSAAGRAEIGAYLQERVMRTQSLEALVDRILDLLTTLRAGRSRQVPA